MKAIMPLDENLEPIQIAYLDTENSVDLDGSSAAVASDVIDADAESVVCLFVKDFGEAKVVRGVTPVASDSVGKSFSGEIYLALVAGEKISVYGAVVNMTVCKR